MIPLSIFATSAQKELSRDRKPREDNALLGRDHLSMKSWIGALAESAAVESRRDEIRAIKRGMMQQLLTGRVRLV